MCLGLDDFTSRSAKSALQSRSRRRGDKNAFPVRLPSGAGKHFHSIISQPSPTILFLLVSGAETLYARSAKRAKKVARRRTMGCVWAREAGPAACCSSPRCSTPRGRGEKTHRASQGLVTRERRRECGVEFTVRVFGGHWLLTLTSGNERRLGNRIRNDEHESLGRPAEQQS